MELNPTIFLPPYDFAIAYSKSHWFRSNYEFCTHLGDNWEILVVCELLPPISLKFMLSMVNLIVYGLPVVCLVFFLATPLGRTNAS